MIRSSFFKLLFFAATALLFAGCGTVEEYVLLNDLDVDSYYKMQPLHELRIKRGDDLRIVVTHKMPELINMFNAKVNSVEGGEVITTYPVNEDGYINFPYFDTLHLEGMTCSEAEQFIAKRISDAGIAQGASVSVKITNFTVTVIGETGTGVYSFEDGNATIFDLIAKADIASGRVNGGNYGGVSIRRDKILVMREVNGVLNSDYISLLTKDILYSPYFYLQQGDVFYVWPSTSVIRGSNGLFDYWWGRLSVLTTAVSVVTLFMTLFNNNKKN